MPNLLMEQNNRLVAFTGNSKLAFEEEERQGIHESDGKCMEWRYRKAGSVSSTIASGSKSRKDSLSKESEYST
jgi:hypothetical protein